MADPFISICVPSYERIEYLDRLFESIKIQTFKNFEVIFTDDSKTENVKLFLQNYNVDFALHYYKNVPALGTAKNMVEGVKYARSNWVKMIHDDDFFADEHALQKCADACSEDVQFIFSGYYEYFEHTGEKRNKTISQKKFASLLRDPSILFADNLIGPPSVLMINKEIKEVFDINLKWFTDMEYYFRILGKEKAVYIDQPLVNISYNDTQITTYTRTNGSIVVWEALYLLNKHGKKITSNIIAYDSWWRVFRNMGISSVKEAEQFAKGLTIPKIVKNIIRHQKYIPQKLIKIGAISKSCMLVSYLLNRVHL